MSPYGFGAGMERLLATPEVRSVGAFIDHIGVDRVSVGEVDSLLRNALQSVAVREQTERPLSFDEETQIAGYG